VIVVLGFAGFIVTVLVELAPGIALIVIGKTSPEFVGRGRITGIEQRHHHRPTHAEVVSAR